MLLNFLFLIFVSYLLFVFISERFNPFVGVIARAKRPQQKLGRHAAIASLFSGVIALLLLELGIQERPALAVYLMLTIVFLIPSFLRYNRSRIWS